jgi:hypothetical protein
MTALYRFHLDISRMGTLHGTFFMEPEEYADILGCSGYACDVLGKHSEIDFTLTDENLTLVTDDAQFLQRAKELGVDLESGFDPRDYLEEDE